MGPPTRRALDDICFGWGVSPNPLEWCGRTCAALAAPSGQIVTAGASVRRSRKLSSGRAPAAANEVLHLIGPTFWLFERPRSLQPARQVNAAVPPSLTHLAGNI